MKARFVARRREMRRRGARATRATASFARVVARGARRAARGGVRNWSVDSRSREERDRSLTVTHTRMSEIVVVFMRDAQRTRAL
jgi:hypothetical protein